jgi:hypothetical protein
MEVVERETEIGGPDPCEIGPSDLSGLELSVYGVHPLPSRYGVQCTRRVRRFESDSPILLRLQAVTGPKVGSTVEGDLVHNSVSWFIPIFPVSDCLPEVLPPVAHTIHVNE